MLGAAPTGCHSRRERRTPTARGRSYCLVEEVDPPAPRRRASVPGRRSRLHRADARTPPDSCVLCQGTNAWSVYRTDLLGCRWISRNVSPAGSTIVRGFGKALLGLGRGRRPRRRCSSRHDRIFAASCLGATVIFLAEAAPPRPSPASPAPVAAAPPRARPRTRPRHIRRQPHLEQQRRIPHVCHHLRVVCGGRHFAARAPRPPTGESAPPAAAAAPRRRTPSGAIGGPVDIAARGGTLRRPTTSRSA